MNVIRFEAKIDPWRKVPRLGFWGEASINLSKGLLHRIFRRGCLHRYYFSFLQPSYYQVLLPVCIYKVNKKQRCCLEKTLTLERLQVSVAVKVALALFPSGIDLNSYVNPTFTILNHNYIVIFGTPVVMYFPNLEISWRGWWRWAGGAWRLPHGGVVKHLALCSKSSLDTLIRMALIHCFVHS